MVHAPADGVNPVQSEFVEHATSGFPSSSTKPSQKLLVGASQAPSPSPLRSQLTKQELGETVVPDPLEVQVGAAQGPALKFMQSALDVHMVVRLLAHRRRPVQGPTSTLAQSAFVPHVSAPSRLQRMPSASRHAASLEHASVGSAEHIAHGQFSDVLPAHGIPDGSETAEVVST
jgi:hypothetical protein